MIDFYAMGSPNVVKIYLALEEMASSCKAITTEFENVRRDDSISAKTSVVSIIFTKGSVGIIYLPGIQSARNGMIDNHRANDARPPATLRVLAFRSPSR